MATFLATDTTPDNLDKLLLIQIGPDKYAGYDKKILALNLHSTEELFLTCKFCNGIMKDAVSYKGENMCSSCSNPESFGLYPATDIRNTVNKLQCKCPLRDRGCKWLGTVSEVCDHIKNVCPKLLIRCSLNCGAVLCKELLESHKFLCPNRIFQCEYCNEYLESKQMNEHLSKCEYCEINCNLECGAKMIRKDLKIHINTICPMAILECPYAKWGCAIKDIKGKDLKEHIQTNLLEHADISFNLTTKLEAKLTECSKDIIEQKTKLTECSKDIIEQKQVSEGLQVKLDNNSKENIQQGVKISELQTELAECSSEIIKQKQVSEQFEQFKEELQNDVNNLRNEYVHGTFGFSKYRSLFVYVFPGLLILYVLLNLNWGVYVCMCMCIYLCVCLCKRRN